MTALDERRVREGVEYLRRYYRAIEDRNGAAFRHALAGFRSLDERYPAEMDRARGVYFGF